MNLKTYNELSRRTRNNSLTTNDQIANALFGLNGEAGEVTEIFKKQFYHGRTFDDDEIMKELGDVMYYWMWLVDVLGFDPDFILQQNVDKLKTRWPEGFYVGQPE